MLTEDQITKLFEELKIRGKRYYDWSQVYRKHQFITIIEEDGGKIRDSEYSFSAKEKKYIAELQKQQFEIDKGEGSEQIRNGHNLLWDFCRISVTENEIEIIPVDLELIDDDELLKSEQWTKKIDRGAAKTIIDYWLKSIDHLNNPDLELANAELWSQLLFYVDEALKGGFIKGMESLLDLMISETGQIEVFLDGGDEIDEFSEYVKANITELKKQTFGSFAQRGWNQSLKHFLEHIAKMMNWEFILIPKDGGKIPNPKNPGGSISKTVFHKNNLIRHYKSKKENIPPTQTEQKSWLYRKLRLKMMNGEKLLPIEEKYYRCMGSRAILKRRELVPIPFLYQIAEARHKTIKDPLSMNDVSHKHNTPAECVS